MNILQKIILIGILLAGFAVFANPASVEEGKALFVKKGCVACHSVGSGARVGPDLKGVTKRDSKAWIIKFLTNTHEMVLNDPHAQELKAQYGIEMPKQNVSNDDIESLYLYFKANE